MVPAAVHARLLLSLSPLIAKDDSRLDSVISLLSGDSVEQKMKVHRKI